MVEGKSSNGSGEKRESTLLSQHRAVRLGKRKGEDHSEGRIRAAHLALFSRTNREKRMKERKGESGTGRVGRGMSAFESRAVSLTLLILHKGSGES